jgi:hypothetical protein
VKIPSGIRRGLLNENFIFLNTIRKTTIIAER